MQREALGSAYSAAWHCIVRQRIRNWVSNLAEANPRRRADHRCSAGRHKMGRGAGFAVVIALTGEMCGRLHDLCIRVRRGALAAGAQWSAYFDCCFLGGAKAKGPASKRDLPSLWKQS